MPTIGHDNNDLGGITFDNTFNHTMQNGVETYTAVSGDTITAVGFWCEGSTTGTVEVGVYRTDTLAKVVSATVTCTSAGRFTQSVSQALTPGVTYASSVRFPGNISGHRDFFTGGGIASNLTGTSALAATFTNNAADDHQLAAFAVVTSSCDTLMGQILT